MVAVGVDPAVFGVAVRVLGLLYPTVPGVRRPAYRLMLPRTSVRSFSLKVAPARGDRFCHVNGVRYPGKSIPGTIDGNAVFATAVLGSAAPHWRSDRSPRSTVTRSRVIVSDT